MKKLLFLIMLSVSAGITAQKFSIEKVSVADLQTMQHPLEPTANAAVLHDVGNVTFAYVDDDFQKVVNVKTRIKIYNKNGYDWANFTIPYYVGTGLKETLRLYDAYTYNLVNGKVQRTKLGSDGQFDEKVNEYWSQKKIVMPAVKEGSIVEIEYQITSPLLADLKEWFFQRRIPTDYSEYRTEIPEYFIYTAMQRGYLNPVITSSVQTKKFVINTAQRNTYGSRNANNHETGTASINVKVTNYVSRNVPSLKDEPYVNNIMNYVSSINHELAYTQFPSGSKNYAVDWEGVTKTIYENDSFGAELRHKNYFTADIDPILASATTPYDKIMRVFDYVKKNVKWNGKYSYYCDNGVRRAYSDKTGNVAEINLMLTAMLRHAGLEANPVLVSTRSHGIVLSPSRTAFNYVISSVELPEGTVLLDATEPYSLPNVLPLRDLNWNGRLIRPNGSSVTIPLVPRRPSTETVNLMYSITPEGGVKGMLRNQFSENAALEFRSEYLHRQEDAYLEQLEARMNHIEISDYTRQGTDLMKPVVESFSFTKNNAMDVINGDIHLTPMLFLTVGENPFKMDKRDFPVDFGYPRAYRYNVSIQIPEGYQVASMPESVNLAGQDGLCSFKYILSQRGTNIQIMAQSDFNHAVVPAEYYTVLKDFYQKLVEKQTEKIVLKKV